MPDLHHFHFPCMEVFHPAGGSIVVWSPEEHAAKLAEGYLTEPPPAPAPSPSIVDTALAGIGKVIDKITGAEDPASEPEAEPAQRRCKNCGEVGHNARTCTNKAA